MEPHLGPPDDRDLAHGANRSAGLARPTTVEHVANPIGARPVGECYEEVLSIAIHIDGGSIRQACRSSGVMDHGKPAKSSDDRLDKAVGKSLVEECYPPGKRHQVTVGASFIELPVPQSGWRRADLRVRLRRRVAGGS